MACSQRDSVKTKITNLFIFVFVALIVYLPMGWYLLTHPAQFSARAFSVMVWNFLDTRAEIMAELGRNLIRIAGFFCCDGSPNPLFGLPNYPGSHIVVLPLLIAGLIGSLRYWRFFFPRLVSIWWFIGLLPTVLAIEAPHPLRMIVAVVPTAILVALGAVYLVQWLSRWRPDLVATEDGLRLVWEDYRDGNAEIYAMKSSEGGRNWEPATRLTEAAGYSIHPQAAASGQTAYVVWQDNRNSKWEVYFTKDRFSLYLPAVMKGE